MNVLASEQSQPTRRPDEKSAADRSAPAAQWSPDLGAPSIQVGAPAGCFGEAFCRSPQRPDANGSLSSFCETPARYPLRDRFYVDLNGLLRPKRFTPPMVSANLIFTMKDRDTPPDQQKVMDPKPGYLGPGYPLQTIIGDVVPASASGGGTLGVVAVLAGPGTQTNVRRKDYIPCRLEPCA